MRTLLVLAAAALAGVAACSSPPPAPPAAPAPVASSSGVVVPTGVPTAPTGSPTMRDDGSTQAPGTGEPLVLDDAAKASAADTGAEVMRLFARPDVDADQWWHDLAPLLTVQAQQAYRYTDPKNVPPTKVTGPATLTPASKALAARVSVPTDAGVYLVILARTEDSPTWLADRIMPPESFGEQ